MEVHPGDMRKLTSPEVTSRLANGQTTAIVVLGGTGAASHVSRLKKPTLVWARTLPSSFRID